MTTGTEGNDSLTNDRTLTNETIDALGGDDVITVLRPNNLMIETRVTVSGGSGFDTLIIDTANSYLNGLSANGFDGSINVRNGLSSTWGVSWTSIERLELTAKFFGNNASYVLGDEIDIIQIHLGLAGGSISTGGGDDEIHVVASGGVKFSADGGGGNDIIDMSAASNSSMHRYVAAGGTGDDVITGSDYNDRLDGGSGDDTITGRGSVFAFANDGDEFVGGQGNDILTGGSTGTDWARYDLETGGGAVHVNLSDSQATVGGVLLDASTARDTFGTTDSLIGMERVSGASGNDHMLGGSGVDKFEGGAGNDTLTGADGGDELTGGAGADTLDAGAGALDWVVYARESGTGSVAVNLSASAATVGGVLLASNTARDTFGTIDTLIGVEQVRGANGNDFFLGSSNNDRFEGWGGNDTIEGAAGNDSLIGDDGDDYLDGGTGADTMNGGFGNDVFIVDDAGDVVIDVFGTPSSDEIRTALVSYVLADNGVENLTGTSNGGQVLAGSGSANVIRGGGGGDLLVGHGGSDQLAGGAGNDTLYGGSQEGNDVADDWAAYDLETGGGAVLVNLSGETQNLGGVVLAAGTARDSFGSTDTLFGIEFVRGTANNDWLVGSNGANRFESGAGNDILMGGAGADAMIGGTGDDSYYVDNAGDTVTENAGEGTDEIRTSLLTYSLLSRPNVENLYSVDDAAHDFRGNAGNNFVAGGGGGDILRMYDGGVDTAFGGGGDDLIYFGAALTNVDGVDGWTGNDTLVIQGDYSGGLILDAHVSRIEGITLLAGNNVNFGNPGTSLYDYVLTTHDINFAAGIQARIDASALLAGEDFTFNGSAETDASFFVYAGRGVNSLTGGSGHDVFLFAGTMDGLDAVDGGAGTDQIALQGGSAFTFGSGVVRIESLGLLSGADTRFGGPGGTLHSYGLTTVDSNVASGASLTVDGAKLLAGENLTFNGGAETDGSFFIYGGRGVDTLTGGAKNDVFLFGPDGHFSASDVVDGGPGGTDQLALRGNYTLTFGAGQMVGIESIGILSAHDTRFGPLGSNYNYNLTTHDDNVAAGVQMTVDGAKLRGTETLVFNGAAETNGSFRIFGGINNDILTGSQNGDILQGNGAADQLTGNGGADSFRYALVSDSGGGAVDHILDFTPGTDNIDLSRIDANSNAAGDQAFSWIGSNAFSGVAGQLRAYQSGSDWFVEGDVNGDSIADLVIALTLQGPTPLGAGDFLL